MKKVIAGVIMSAAMLATVNTAAAAPSNPKACMGELRSQIAQIEPGMMGTFAKWVDNSQFNNYWIENFCQAE